MALISAMFLLSQSTPLMTPVLLLLNQNLGIRASDLKSFGFASHFFTQSSVSFPGNRREVGADLSDTFKARHLVATEASELLDQLPAVAECRRQRNLGTRVVALVASGFDVRH